MGVAHMMHHRTARQTARLRQIVVAAVLCLAVYCFLAVPRSTTTTTTTTNYQEASYQRQGQGQRQRQGSGANRRLHTPSPELLNNRFLAEDECRATFPGLLDQVDDEVARGPFTLERPTSSLGPLIARIRDGQLYILSATRKADMSRDMLAHRGATLHQIANALLTWPRPAASDPSSPFSHIPDTIFAFSHHDDPASETFSYSRPADPELLVHHHDNDNDNNNNNNNNNKDGKTKTTRKRFFPIPHFSFYAWPLPFIGSLPRAAAAIDAVEAATAPSSSSSFAAKIPRAVWRGTTWFNNPRAGRLRQNLVRAFGTGASASTSTSTSSAGDWADIEALDWSSATTDGSGSGSASGNNNGGGGGGGSNGIMAPGAGERNATNALRIEDFCRYRYIVHTEGVTYSGRFQFHSLCASVVLTPPVAWFQHLTHLLRPAFTYALDPDAPDLPLSLSSSSSSSSSSAYSASGPGLPRTSIDLGPNERRPALAPYPAPWVRAAWPVAYDPAPGSSSSDNNNNDDDDDDDGKGANILFVAPDWSDLPAAVAWLEARPRLAAALAARQRRLFAGAGYLSPAAEACYWRGLVRAWARLVRFDEAAFADLEGVPWEEFSLREMHG